MANFNTHLTVGAIGAGMLATLSLQVGFVNNRDALLIAGLGTLASILPDIDLKYSTPSKLIFTTLGIISAFLTIFATKNSFSIIELWMLGITTFLLIRFGLWHFFQKFTVHRGAIHSLTAALFFSFFSTAISFHFFGKTDFIAWLIGFSVGIGFITHLILDELYSVDFMNQRIKRSFGSAFKLLDRKQRFGSGFLALLVIILWFFLPSSAAFIDTLLSIETYQLLWNRLLPAQI